MKQSVFKTVKFEWLQVLRALGAVAVLLFHMTPHFEASAPLAFLATATRWGFSGVDIFFVLSGFVVCRAAHFEIPLIGKIGFFLKRSIRIYAGYWMALLIFFFVDLIVLGHAAPNATKLIRSIFLLYPITFDNVLGVAWSLTYELYFYILVFLLFFVFSTKRTKVVAVGMVIVLLSNVIPFLLNRNEVLNGTFKLHFVTTPFLVEFFTGFLIGASYERIKAFLEHTLESVSMGIVLIILGFTLGTMSPIFTAFDLLRISCWGLVSVGFLVTFLAFQEANWQPPKLLISIGDASFSLYLIHLPLLDLSGNWRFSLFSSGAVGLSTWLTAVTPFAIVGLSLLWYRFIEKPIQINVYKIISRNFEKQKFVVDTAL